MTLSLKTQNKPLLATLLLWNLAMLYVALASKSHDWAQIVAISVHWQQALLPAGIAVIAVGVVTDQLSAEWKARLVFWRWNNPLPAAEAFSVLGPSDPRIDMTDLEKRHGPFPTAPADQNRAWYKLLKSVEGKSRVLAPHKTYLLYRDYTCLSLAILGVAIPLVLWKHPPTVSAAVLFAVLASQYLLARNAARLAGHRLVTTVMAIC